MCDTFICFQDGSDISNEDISSQTINILSKIINCSTEDISITEQDVALDNYVKLFVNMVRNNLVYFFTVELKH